MNTIILLYNILQFQSIHHKEDNSLGLLAHKSYPTFRFLVKFLFAFVIIIMTLKLINKSINGYFLMMDHVLCLISLKLISKKL